MSKAESSNIFRICNNAKRNITMIDSTFSPKAHRMHAANLMAETTRIGKSKGGFTTKIHSLANIEGKPLDLPLLAARSSDTKEGSLLIEAICTE